MFETYLCCKAIVNARGQSSQISVEHRRQIQQHTLLSNRVPARQSLKRLASSDCQAETRGSKLDSEAESLCPTTVMNGLQVRIAKQRQGAGKANTCSAAFVLANDRSTCCSARSS